MNERRSHNLPHALTSFVGREREIAEVAALLGETRMLTLTGSGGVGKTRLAHQVASGLFDAFPDGVWLVELSALADATLVPKAVAIALGLREEPGRPLTATLAEALRSQQRLLLLDNCEHLIEACATFADRLLRACPALRILATSRQPLGIAGETTFWVPSLALAARSRGTTTPAPREDWAHAPLPGPTSTPERIEPSRASDAVRLFVERAQAAAPAFALTGRNNTAVETICRRLDGIPLAIELAAARVSVLSPEQIATRLDDRFHLLSGGSRTALPRYRTLRALIDWSHDLLEDQERLLLRRLAVFAGGWTLEAAEAVGTGDGIEHDQVLDLLSGLIARSLVLPSRHADGVRYGFLESLREYALEKLRDADEEEVLRDRHCRWFVALAEQAEPELTGPHQEAWLDRLDRERENLRAAQEWAVTRGDGETLARFGASLWRFWWARADAADARVLIEAIVPLARQGPPSSSLARALHGAGILAGTFAEYATCRSLLEAGLAVARQLDDRLTLATLLDSLGRQVFIEGRYAEARPLLDEGVAIFRDLGERRALARALSHLGFLDYLEDRQESARAIYREGLDLASEAGDSGSVAEFLDNLGRTFHAEGDFESAARSYEDAVTIWRSTGQGPWLAMALNNLGCVQTLRGDLGAARSQLAEALSLSHRMGNRRRQAFTLAAIATLAAVAGQPERALRLDAVASAAVAQIGASLVQPAYALGIPHLDRARRMLGPAAVAEATATGSVTTLAQAVEETLAWLAEPESFAQIRSWPAGGASSPPFHEVLPRRLNAPPVLAVVPSPRGVGLSPRELEVAALVARGMTNRQIAAELTITEGTAANHVKHILARLVLDSRVQIATWAIERGLHRRPAS